MRTACPKRSFRSLPASGGCCAAAVAGVAGRCCGGGGDSPGLAASAACAPRSHWNGAAPAGRRIPALSPRTRPRHRRPRGAARCRTSARAPSPRAVTGPTVATALGLRRQHPAGDATQRITHVPSQKNQPARETGCKERHISKVTALGYMFQTGSQVLKVVSMPDTDPADLALRLFASQMRIPRCAEA